MNWKILEIDEREIALKYQVDPLCAKLLSAGQLSDDQIRELLDPDLRLTTSEADCVKKCASRLLQAREKKEKVFVGGDYDADGICATAIMKDLLDRLNIENGYYIPNRFEEGYGLSSETVERAAEKGYTLILTVDNGVKAFAAVEKAHELGLEIYVTDHHTIDTRPDADLIVHPDDMEPEYAYLSGAGVALQISRTLLGDVPEHTALAAVAAIGDVMPLWRETRKIVLAGVPLIHTLPVLPLKTLFRNGSRMDERAVAFEIVPKLNSAGRMNDLANVNTLVRYLLLKDPEQVTRYAMQLETVNDKRKELSAQMTERAEQLWTDDALPVIYEESFHEGICGLAAGRLCEKFRRPVLVMARHGDEIKGSGRSVPGFDLYSFFAGFEGLTSFGGHEQAVGIGIRAEDLDQFRLTVKQRMETMRIPQEQEEKLAILIRREDLTFDYIASVQSLYPLPKELSELRFALRGEQIREYQELKNIYKYKIDTPEGGLEAVAFPWQKLKRTPAPYLLIGMPNLNRWRNSVTKQLILDDIE